MCVRASGAMKTKKWSGVWYKEAESDGFILAKGWVGTLWAQQRHPCQFVDVPLCLSVSQPATPTVCLNTAGWIKPGNWVNHK